MPDQTCCCTCCGKTLKKKDEAVWLELDHRTGCYHDFGHIPPIDNQGGFPFGSTCARRARAKAKRARDDQLEESARMRAIILSTRLSHG